MTIAKQIETAFVEAFKDLTVAFAAMVAEQTNTKVICHGEDVHEVMFEDGSSIMVTSTNIFEV